MTMHIELIGEVNIYFGLGLELVTSIILGGMVGLERERKMKPAGIKTNVLICLGSTLYTALSLLNQQAAAGAIDPNRVAAQIVSGIGFLGAGAIIQSRGEILGLTTAATIWVVAALGVAIGSGYPMVAAICTVTVLVVLALIDPIYQLLDLRREFHVNILSETSIVKEVREIFKDGASNITRVDERVVDSNKDLHLLVLVVTMNPKTLKSITYRIQEMVQVRHVMVDSHVMNGHKKKNGVGPGGGEGKAA